MSIAVKSGLPSLGSTEGAVISADEVSVSEDGSAAASVGEDLPRGKSAYEIAKENGFNGTETEWLASLKGEPGAAGASGKDGENGKTPYVGDNGNWYIGADDTGKPSRGAKGEKGEKGDTGAQGIQGEKGDTGAQGPQGAAGADGKTPYVGDNGNWFVGSDDTGKPSRGEKGEPGSPGAKGDKGDPGATPNLTIGSVTTLDAGQNATASMGGTAESPVLNLGIPRGAKGEPGEGGGGTYYVELDGNFPNYTLSETTPLADIAAAYNDGKTMFCRCSMGSFTATLPLFVPIAELNTWIFSGSGGAAVISFPAQYFTIIVSAQGVTAENKRLVRTDAIVSSVSASSTHDDVPSAKCVYDELQERSLKQATSDTLGGVKADPATAYDTQPVRIDDSGKLVTAAGGADISLGLTSAAVGQIIKVKAIDESGKPTAWEAADMPSGGGSGGKQLLYRHNISQDTVLTTDSFDTSGANIDLSVYSHLYIRGMFICNSPAETMGYFYLNGTKFAEIQYFNRRIGQTIGFEADIVCLKTQNKSSAGLLSFVWCSEFNLQKFDNIYAANKKDSSRVNDNLQSIGFSGTADNIFAVKAGSYVEVWGD